MIVAAGAADGQAHEGAGDGVDLLIDHVHAEDRGIAFDEIVRAEGEEAGGGQLLVVLVFGVGREQVARDLFAHELVVRHIVIETRRSRSCDSARRRGRR